MKEMDYSSKQVVYRKSANYSVQLLFEASGKLLLDDLTVASCNPSINTASQEIKVESEKITPDNVTESEVKQVVPDYMTCNCCQAHFADREEQLAHYKCDWHRYNLHLRLKGLTFVSEEEFEAAAAGDVSSISGSDEEDDSDYTLSMKKLAETPDIEGEGNFVLSERKFYKVFFKTKKGELVSLFRCLLHDKKNPLYEPDNILAAVSQLPEKKNWIILMVSSGHFAGTVFHGKEVIEHKTFHRYTVRAKRGTAQSTKDGQGGAPKSAGATLRRYNEAALVQDVQDLLLKWEEHIKTCDFVFVRIPVANKAMFFGGKNPAFRKDDCRIRVIPFATRRPTFNETKRVHQMLASVECYGPETEVSDIIPLSPPRIYNSETGQPVTRKDISSPKSTRGTSKRQTAQEPNTLDTGTQDKYATETLEDAEGQEKGIEMDLVETFEEIDFSGLKQFESTMKRKHKKKKTPLDEKQNSNKDVYLDKEMTTLRNSLFTACKIGCLDSVHHCLQSISNLQSHNEETSLKNSRGNDTIQQYFQNLEAKNSSIDNDAHGELIPGVSIDSTQESSSHDQLPKHSIIACQTTSNICSLASFLNMPLRNDGTAFLHIAAKEGHSEIVTALLRSGADPVVRNKEGKTPYNLGETEVRNAFRRFMADFPDRYDYNKAQIPGPLTAEMEAEKKQKAAEKRKAKKKALQERQKDKKASEAKVQVENQEKERFLALSDREKRALAAEKRILEQFNDQGLSKPVLSRCWQCGTDVTGKIPFEYFDYKFCTTKCLKEHRSKPTNST